MCVCVCVEWGDARGDTRVLDKQRETAKYSLCTDVNLYLVLSFSASIMPLTFQRGAVSLNICQLWLKAYFIFQNRRKLKRLRPCHKGWDLGWAATACKCTDSEACHRLAFFLPRICESVSVTCTATPDCTATAKPQAATTTNTFQSYIPELHSRAAWAEQQLSCHSARIATNSYLKLETLQAACLCDCALLCYFPVMFQVWIFRTSITTLPHPLPCLYFA